MMKALLSVVGTGIGVDPTPGVSSMWDKSLEKTAAVRDN